MNCCLSYLFYCCIAGTFVFIILGIFTYKNNSFLIIENMKNEDSLIDDIKYKAYLQYFFAALFDSIFALLLYFLNVLLCDNEKTKQEIPKNKKMIEITNSVGSQDSNNNNNIINNPDNKNSNIRNISNEIDTNNGMTEKDY